MGLFRPIEQRLINRVATYYTHALQLLTLLPTIRSKEIRREVFERAERTLSRIVKDVRDFRLVYKNAAPAENIIGSAMFRGSLEFVKSLKRGGELTEFGYALALLDGELRGNFVGPIEHSEEAEAKLKNLPLVRDLCGLPYRLFSPEKSVSRFYAQQIQIIAVPFRKEREEANRRKEAKQQSVSAQDLLTMFKGVFVTDAPMNGSPVYLEIRGDGSSLKVVRAEGVAEDLIGQSFGRGKLPGVIYREIQRKDGLDRRGRKPRRRSGGSNLRLISGGVARAA